MKKALALFCAFVVLFAGVSFVFPQKASAAYAWDGSVASSFDGGSGTSKDPYLISDGSQLAYLAQLVNSNTSNYSSKYYVLTNDIDLNNVPWVPIGSGSSSSGNAFLGVFNGKGYTVTNLSMGDESLPSASIGAGLFGVVGSSGVIKNVSVRSATVFQGNMGSGTACGVIAAVNYGVIDDCQVVNVYLSVRTGSCGSFCGENYGTIKNSDSTIARLDSLEDAILGGFVGVNHSVIRNCYSRSITDVNSYASCFGGFAGANSGSIVDSYSYETSADERRDCVAGGFVGANSGEIANSYVQRASIIANGIVGGFAGENKFTGGSGSIVNCYVGVGCALTETSGSGKCGYFLGSDSSYGQVACYYNSSIMANAMPSMAAVPLTGEEMMSPSFVSALNSSLKSDWSTWVVSPRMNEGYPAFSGSTADVYQSGGDHKVSVSMSEGGAIVPNGTLSIEDGDSVTFTILPYEGYVIENIIVDGEQLGSLGSYTLSDVKAEHVVRATFRKIGDNFYNIPADEGDIPKTGYPVNLYSLSLLISGAALMLKAAINKKK